MGAVLAVAAVVVAGAVVLRAALEHGRGGPAGPADAVLRALVVVTEPLYLPVRAALPPVSTGGRTIDTGPAVVLAGCLLVAAALW